MTTPSALNTALAEQAIPCRPTTDSLGDENCFYEHHDSDCPAAYRPAVALALQSKDDSAALEIASRDAVNAELRGALVQMANAGGDQIREIVRLKGEIARLRAALEPFAKAADQFRGNEGYEFADVRIGDLRKARAALQTDGGKL